MTSAEEEFDKVRADFRAYDKRLLLKVDKEEGQRIWDNFQQYAYYDDLKDLYAKTMPEIKKFEDKIVQFGVDLEKIDIILRRFDEVITEKASKMDLRDFGRTIQLYVKNTDFQTSVSEVNQRVQ